MEPEKTYRFEKMAQITFAIRRFLNEKGFLEIKTPMLVPIYGGATAKPFRTYLNALSSDFYLSISHELNLKRLVVAGFENVFNLTGYFRNEGIDRSHNPEFQMLEAMSAFHNYEFNMDLMEQLYRYIAKEVFGKYVFKVRDQDVDFSKPFERIMMIDAVKKYTKYDFNKVETLEKAHEILKEINYPKAFPNTIGECMVEVFATLVEDKLIQPTFIYGHPVEISPLAKRMQSDKRFVERFEIFVGGIEQGDNWSELNDPLELYERFKDQFNRRKEGNEEAHPMEVDFLEALEYGMPPTTGLGPGIERLVMTFTETDYIDDVLFFPVMKPLPATPLQKTIYRSEYLNVKAEKSPK